MPMFILQECYQYKDVHMQNLSHAVCLLINAILINAIQSYFLDSLPSNEQDLLDC